MQSAGLNGNEFSFNALLVMLSRSMLCLENLLSYASLLLEFPPLTQAHSK